VKEKRNLSYYVWLAHRISGVILVLYLFAHLWTLSAALAGEKSFDQTLQVFDNPVVRFFELILVAVVVFHTLNGLRLICLDLLPALPQEALSYTVIIITVLAALASVPFFF
jgi:succinate dehydrogenase / fumarate reductase cytochrome b subunit